MTTGGARVIIGGLVIERVAALEKRVELNWLLDFYGPLLTEHRREIVRMYCEEDLSLQEIADALSITRQGVHDALANAQKQLTAYEDKLMLLSRYKRVQAEVRACREELERARAGDADALMRAMRALDAIEA